MFEQAFVDGTQKKNPASLGLSLLLQIAAVGLLTLIPLVYTERLSSAQLRNLLVAPSPPPVPAHTQQANRQAAPKQVFRPINSTGLVAPTAIPKQINSGVFEAPPAVDASSIIAAGAETAGNSLAFGVVTLGAPAPQTQNQVTKPTPKSGPMTVGGKVAEANLIHRVQPVYPPIARSARIQGTVEFTAIISKEGNIEDLQVLRGHPLLVNAARDAVLQWKYRPTLLNAQPVEVITDIVVNFTLSQQ